MLISQHCIACPDLALEVRGNTTKIFRVVEAFTHMVTAISYAEWMIVITLPAFKAITGEPGKTVSAPLWDGTGGTCLHS